LLPELLPTLGAMLGSIAIVPVLGSWDIPILGSVSVVGVLDPESKLGKVAGPLFEPEFGVKLVSTLVPTGGVAIPVLLSVVGLVVVGPPFIGGTTCPVLGSVIGLTITSEPLLDWTDVGGKPVVSTDVVAVFPALLSILELTGNSVLLPTVGVAVVVSIGITIDPVLGSVIGLTTASTLLVGKIAGLGVKPGRLGFEPCLGLSPGPGKCGLIIGPLSTQ